MRKMYILTLRLFETLVVCHICKSTIVEFDWKFSFFFLPPSWGARVAWWEWVRALASRQCGPGSNPGVDALRGSEFVVGSLPCSERFFIGYSGFPLSPQEPTLQSKFQFDLEWRTRLNEFIRTRWCFVGKQITICNLQSFRPFQHTTTDLQYSACGFMYCFHVVAVGNKATNGWWDTSWIADEMQQFSGLISKFTVSHLALWFRLYVQIHYSQHSQWCAKLKYTQLTGWTWLVKQFHVCLRNSWWLIVEIIHSCSVLNEVTQGWTAHPTSQRIAWVLVTTPTPSCPSSA